MHVDRPEHIQTLLSSACQPIGVSAHQYNYNRKFVRMAGSREYDRSVHRIIGSTIVIILKQKNWLVPKDSVVWRIALDYLLIFGLVKNS